MNSSPELFHSNKGSLPACCRIYASLNRANPLLFTHKQRVGRLFLSILHEEGRRAQPIVCNFARTGHRSRFSYGRLRQHPKKSTPSHGKPAQFGHTKTNKKTKTQKEVEVEEVFSKITPPKPSEDCIARLLEQQPIRLQNNNATFQSAAQDSNTLTHEAPVLEKERFQMCSNGILPLSRLNGDAMLKPDFSIKLLDILASFKQNNQLDDVQPTGDLGLQPAENNPEEDAVEQISLYNGFGSSELQRDSTVEIERQMLIMDEASIEGIQPIPPKKDEVRSHAMVDSSRKDVLESSLTCNGSLNNQLALKESDSNSESSDRSADNEAAYSPAFLEVENVSLQNEVRNFEGKGRLISGSSPPAFCVKGWSSVFPRHRSRSTGSRSSPSKSSIPGLQSKYSKPDPKAIENSRLKKQPLKLLPKFDLEAQSEGEEEDDVTLKVFQRADKQPEGEVNFDWWDSDEEEEPKDHLLSDAQLPTVTNSKRKSSELMKNSELKIETCNLSQLKGEVEGIGSSRCVETKCKQTDTKHKECISFELFDSDEESNDGLFEWSDSDADSSMREEEEGSLKRKDEDVEENISNTEGRSTWPKQDVATNNSGPASDPISTLYNREYYQNAGSNMYSNRKVFLRANQLLNQDALHQLPASVKFVAAPLWKSLIFPDFPFEVHYSYSEIPKAPILGFRDHISPFAPETMERPWTGGAQPKARRDLKPIEPFDHALERKNTVERTFNRKSEAPKRMKSREEVLGKPLTAEEVITLVQKCHAENRKVNIGRDGFTHNMLHLIHTHWKKRPVCKLRCRGVSTLDMDNVCFHIEDKTGGKIIYRSGGTVYLFRGRNYVYEDRPVVPFMLFRPSSPVYPKLVPQAPAGLTIEEARQLRILGQKVKPLLNLRKNSVLLDLLGDVRDAFKVDDLVSLDCEAVKSSDYRQIGAKLMELVPCVLLSFRNNRIVLWKGRHLEPLSNHCNETCADGAAAEPTLEATDVEGSSLSASETKYKGSGNGFSLSQADVLPVQSFEDAVLTAFKEEGSARVHHSDVASICELMGRDTSDVILDKVVEQTELDAESNKLAGSDTNGGGGIEKASCADVVSSHTVFPVYESTNCSSDCSGSSVRDCSDGQQESSFPSSRVDVRWEMALQNGMAVELEGEESEADLIFHKVSVFSEVAPVGPVYTEKMVNRLRLRGVYSKTQKRFVVPLHAIRRKNQHLQNKATKRTSRLPNIAPLQSPRLQTDDLIKKLECTYM